MPATSIDGSSCDPYVIVYCNNKIYRTLTKVRYAEPYPGRSPAAPPHPRPLDYTPCAPYQWGTLHPRYDESFEIDVTNPNATVHRDTPHCVHVTP